MVERTVFSLPVGLHHRMKALAEGRGMSMAAFVRETLEQVAEVEPVHRISEERATYTAVLERPREAEEMKRLVISLPDQLLERVRRIGVRKGVSMAAVIRDSLEARATAERPKPRFGAFASGFTDTGRMAGEIQYEPRSWR